MKKDQIKPSEEGCRQEGVKNRIAAERKQKGNWVREMKKSKLKG
jgi:hypothetical protein